MRSCNIGSLLEKSNLAGSHCGRHKRLGNFIGHIVMGDRWIREKVAEIRKKGKDFDQILEGLSFQVLEEDKIH